MCVHAFVSGHQLKWICTLNIQGCLYLYVLHICRHVHVCYGTACVWQCMFTCAGELLRRRGEQQFVGHVTRPGTAGNARLLVAALDPVWQPLHVAVTVQRVGTQSTASQGARGEWDQCSVILIVYTGKVSNLTSESLFHFRSDVLEYRAKTKENVQLSKYLQTDLYITVKLSVKTWYMSTINNWDRNGADWEYLSEGGSSVGCSISQPLKNPKLCYFLSVCNCCIWIKHLYSQVFADVL